MSIYLYIHIYFKNIWVDWYEFLGIDKSSYPDKSEFINKTKNKWIECKNYGIFTEYCKKNKLPYFDMVDYMEKLITIKKRTAKKAEEALEG